MTNLRSGAALLGIAVAALAGCVERPERVVIGVAVNARTHVAVKQAIAEINAAGGIDGVPLEGAGFDWDSDAATSDAVIEWANRFADQSELLGVVGHSNSAATLTSAAIYNRRQVPQLVTIATNPAITDIGPWTYRLCISDALQGPALARYAVEEWGRRRIAVIYANDEYGKGLVREFRREAESLGAEIIESAFHTNIMRDEDRAQIEAVLRRLRGSAAEPDLFVLVQRTEAGLWTVRKIREIGFATPILGADNFSLNAFLDSRPPEGAELRVSSFYAGPAPTPRGREFERVFRERNGRAPDYGDAYAYDAVYLFRDAVAGGGFSRDGVRRYLDRIIADRQPIHGVAGEFVLGPDHDARRGFFIVELTDGAATVVRQISIE